MIHDHLSFAAKTHACTRPQRCTEHINTVQYACCLKGLFYTVFFLFKNTVSIVV
jgi:hypothetical protein